MGWLAKRLGQRAKEVSHQLQVSAPAAPAALAKLFKWIKMAESIVSSVNKAKLGINRSWH